MRNTLKPASILCLAALLAACGDNSGSNTMKGETVEKMQNPGGTLAATSTREGGDAKTPARFHVYVQKSREPAQAIEVLDVDHSVAPVLRWIGPNGLEVIVECGQVHRFSNFADVWSSDESRDKAEMVVVMLDNRGVCPAGGAAPPPSADR
jgi:hypothetical protein